MKQKKDILEIIECWKKLKVRVCKMTFSCGGDSMNDYQFVFENDKDKTIKPKKTNQDRLNKLETYFDREVFEAVNFYEASDGHYIGESGVVIIELDGDEFVYSKSSTSEFDETLSDVVEIKLNQKQINFIEKNVLSFSGDEYDNTEFIFKRDFILTDDDEKLLEELGKLISSVAGEHEFISAEGEPNDWFSYASSDNDILVEDLKIEDDSLYFIVNRSHSIFRED
jgi:hypothetical protein